MEIALKPQELSRSNCRIPANITLAHKLLLDIFLIFLTGVFDQHCQPLCSTLHNQDGQEANS